MNSLVLVVEGWMVSMTVATGVPALLWTTAVGLPADEAGTTTGEVEVTDT